MQICVRVCVCISVITALLNRPISAGPVGGRGACGCNFSCVSKELFRSAQKCCCVWESSSQTMMPLCHSVCVCACEGSRVHTNTQKHWSMVSVSKSKTRTNGMTSITFLQINREFESRGNICVCVCVITVCIIRLMTVMQLHKHPNKTGEKINLAEAQFYGEKGYGRRRQPRMKTEEKNVNRHNKFQSERWIFVGVCARDEAKSFTSLKHKRRLGKQIAGTPGGWPGLALLPASHLLAVFGWSRRWASPGQPGIANWCSRDLNSSWNWTLIKPVVGFGGRGELGIRRQQHMVSALKLNACDLIRLLSWDPDQLWCLRTHDSTWEEGSWNKIWSYFLCKWVLW